MISEKTIQEINDATRIEDVVAEFVTLKQAGQHLKACCPFHGEKTPSFTVHPARNSFKCFGCGKGGDAITFLREHKGMSYPDALRWLAGRYRIVIEETTQGNPERFERSAEIRATLSALQAHFTSDGPDGATNPGREYWMKRGYTPATIDAYGVGYCPAVSAPHITPEALQKAGVANDKGNLSYYRRATLPIHNYRGDIISMVGRSMDADSPAGDKYLNGRNVEGVYEKGKYLYNLNRAHRHIQNTGEVWIVEGYADSMALTQLGKPQNVALCGTELTDAHLSTLKGYTQAAGGRAIRFYLGLDDQTAVIDRRTDWDDERKKAEKTKWENKYWDIVGRLLSIGEVRVVSWPGSCKDAGEIVERGLNFAATKNEDAIEFYIKKTISKEWSTTASAIEKSEFQEQVARLIGRVEKDAARDIYINSLSGLIEIQVKKLEDMVKRIRSKGKVDEQQGISKELMFVKVKDEYLQRIARKDAKTGSITICYEPRRVAELKDEYGSKFVKDITRFHGWVTEPGHTDYTRTVEYWHEKILYRFFNRYQPPPYTAKEFEIPAAFKSAPDTYDLEQIQEIKHSARFLKHLFRTERELNVALDMIALKWTQPRTKIRSLALVSSEEGTGKSTFIDWMLKIFGQNATKTEIQRMTDNFNALMSGKVIVGIEETKDEKGNVENRLKDLITGYETVTRRMYQEAVVEENFAWYIFASNHEDSFMKVGANTTRFFVVKVTPIETIDPDFVEKLYREIPYFLHFIERRGTVYPKEDRLWHRQDLVENEALNRLRQSSKDVVQQNMEELLQSIFLRCEHTYPCLRYDSGYLKALMQAYGGRLYEQKTPNYFLKVATTDMKCVYNAVPKSFRMIQLKDLNHSNFLTLAFWAHEECRPKSRYIEFPIWRFCTAEDVLTNYPPEKVADLLKNFANDAAYLAETYGTAPQEFVEKIKSVQLARMGVIPF